MRSLIISVFLYACESWILTAELEKRMQAFEIRYYRRLLTFHIRTMLPTRRFPERSKQPLENMVNKQKLRWFGHVSRSSGLAKTILQGTVKGKRTRNVTVCNKCPRRPLIMTLIPGCDLEHNQGARVLHRT